DRLAGGAQRTAVDPQPVGAAGWHHVGDRHRPPPVAAIGLAGAGGRWRQAAARRPARRGTRTPASGRGQARAGGAAMSLQRHNDVFDGDEVRASGSSRGVLWVAGFLAMFLAWAWWFEVDEVCSGGGRVVPTSRE